MNLKSARLWIGEHLLRPVLKPLFRAWFRMELRGLENLDGAGPRRVLIANHCSLLDAVILAVTLPGRLSFAMSAVAARRWWGRPARWFADVHELDPENPFALRTLADLARSGRTVLVFPEGRLTTTGALMKTYPGAVRIARWADARLVPVWLGGFTRLPFARCRGRNGSLRPRLSVTVCEAVDAGGGAVGGNEPDAGELLRGAAVAAAASDTGDLFSALERSVGRGEILDDHRLEPLSGGDFLARSLAMGDALCRGLSAGEAVGLLLPNACATLQAIVGVSAAGRVPALLNPAAGFGSLESCARAARIGHVWTSSELVRRASLEPVVAGLRACGVRIHFMETDLPRRRATLVWAAARLSPRTTRSLLRRGPARGGEDPAVILFTSGSTGAPKGVVLSHRNLLSQCAQILAATDISPADKVFNALPLFHAFGLTGAALAPLLAGAAVHFHPSPLDYARIPEAVYRSGATILPGTSTFLAGWARRAHAYDFHTVRMVMAGAEPVRESVRSLYRQRFGLRILEGYGCTECAPVIALNSGLRNRDDAAGWAVAGVELRLDAVDRLDVREAAGDAGLLCGRLSVRGPNVMLGYLTAERPGELVRPAGGWHDTGDIVARHHDGSLRIIGRAARFAKIGGEMVSLAAVEQFAARVSPGHAHAAATLPHPAKGEEIVLVTEDASLTRAALVAAAAPSGVPELWIPRRVIQTERLPVLATGKADHARIASLVREGGRAAEAESAPALVEA